MAEALVTYMEMLEAPHQGASAVAPVPDLRIVREPHLSVSLYLRLQEQIGALYHWVERPSMSEAELERIIHHAEVDLYVLYCAGTIAGFCEQDRRQFPEIEIKFFGLLPQFIGKGLGSYFIQESVALAWQHRPSRLWLHTDSNDHQRALDTYKKAGFKIYQQRVETVRLSPAAPI